MPLTLDLNELLENIKQVAAERPDTVYQKLTCEFDLENDEPPYSEDQYFYTKGNFGHGCLIGEGLYRTSKEVWEIVLEMEKETYAGSDGMDVSTLLAELENEKYVMILHQESKSTLMKIQSKQDIGETWGNAVQLAEEE